MDQALIASMSFTVAATLICTVSAPVLGAGIVGLSRRPLVYGGTLFALLLPYASGGSIWAYSAGRLLHLLGLTEDLGSSDSLVRFGVVLALVVARCLPLGVFFCATMLHAHEVAHARYMRVYGVSPGFRLAHRLRATPPSIYLVVGLFVASTAAGEAALPYFLFRANPGTPPETVGIALSRVLRETYGTNASSAVADVAVTGLRAAATLLTAGALSSFAAAWILRLFQRIPYEKASFAWRALAHLARIAGLLATLPSLVILVSMLGDFRSPYALRGVAVWAGKYVPITALGLCLGAVITLGGLACVVAARYSDRDQLRPLLKSRLIAALLFTPAFVPALSVVYALSALQPSSSSQACGVLSMGVSQFFLRYPVFLCFSAVLILSVPALRVAWQRRAGMRFWFSFCVDGIKRHRLPAAALGTLCMLQVVTDDAAARWFSNVVRSPEEDLYAAVFGRLASFEDAHSIASSLIALSAIAALALGISYARSASDTIRI